MNTNTHLTVSAYAKSFEVCLYFLLCDHFKRYAAFGMIKHILNIFTEVFVREAGLQCPERWDPLAITVISICIGVHPDLFAVIEDT